VHGFRCMIVSAVDSTRLFYKTVVTSSKEVMFSLCFLFVKRII